jgi:hypothetical protein
VDGRLRRDIRITLILDPAVALVAWVHFAPQLSDGFRKSYRQFLRWNDELPFVKFALSSDERPVLSSELPATELTIDSLGLALARLVSVCDLLVPESAHWLWPGQKAPPEPATGTSRQEAFLERFAEQLAELTAPIARQERARQDGAG